MSILKWVKKISKKKFKKAKRCSVILIMQIKAVSSMATTITSKVYQILTSLALEEDYSVRLITRTRIRTILEVCSQAGTHQ